VAVVGSRAATSYGLELAGDLGRDLATMGQTVISGAAYGIDQAAHRGALVAGGSTIAVLPGGAVAPTQPHMPSSSTPSRNGAWSSPRARPA
jgi:DNA processing protein